MFLPQKGEGGFLHPDEGRKKSEGVKPDPKIKNRFISTMYYQIKYLKHLLTASNQHGIHSPFVYDYVTNCLYGKSPFKGSKTEKILLKSMDYFAVEKFKIISDTIPLEKRIEDEFSLLPSEEGPFDLLYFDELKIELLSGYRDKIYNDSLIIVKGIHENKNASNIWEAIKQDELVQVSIDLFYCGILFFRKEQEKEHFKIRI